MKKVLMIFLGFVMVAFLIGITAHFAVAKKDECTTIQSGTLLRSDDVPIVVGYDEWGYNYQAHMFNGYYCDAYRDAAWCQPYKDVELMMKWNDAWISNKDCDNDGYLDRHFGFETYIGSGAWLTNHQSGTEVVDGIECKWYYYVKIVAVTGNDYVDEPYDADGNGTYYNSEGIEIGPQIWGAFAIVLQVYNDPCFGAHGVEYKSPVGPGFGKWK